MLPDFRLIRPSSVAEAVSIIDDDHVPLGGGTELLLAMKLGLLRPTALVDISRLDELQRLETDDKSLVIGGGVTHRRAAADALVREQLPMLATVERAVGNPRVRVQGSIGGNLCFAEPKSDVATALIALDASVVLIGPTGVREVPMQTFIDGPYTTVRNDDEILVEVRVPLVPSRRGRYVKFQTMERPTLGVAAVADEQRVRVVVGAVGLTPVHADYGAVSEVDVDGLIAQVEPLPDLTGSVEYKQHLTEVYVRKALEDL